VDGGGFEDTYRRDGVDDAAVTEEGERPHLQAQGVTWRVRQVCSLSF